MAQPPTPTAHRNHNHRSSDRPLSILLVTPASSPKSAAPAITYPKINSTSNVCAHHHIYSPHNHDCSPSFIRHDMTVLESSQDFDLLCQETLHTRRIDFRAYIF